MANDLHAAVEHAAKLYRTDRVKWEALPEKLRDLSLITADMHDARERRTEKQKGNPQ
jgi:hypothetical protein